jgi:hypothetical protein
VSRVTVHSGIQKNFAVVAAGATYRSDGACGRTKVVVEVGDYFLVREKKLPI